MSVVDSVKARLNECEYIIQAQMAEIDKLRAENERLMAACDAHGVLKTIYLNRDLPESLRAKAATAALPHETPKLMPERAPLELQAAEVIPLQELVRARKERQDRMEGLPWDDPPKLLRNGNGNGSDGSDEQTGS